MNFPIGKTLKVLNVREASICKISGLAKTCIEKLDILYCKNMEFEKLDFGEYSESTIKDSL